jgi:2-polyprenyl-3-methyl-5-hydroxy-6-metoxy-1,4-benzoquinol methylase
MLHEQAGELNRRSWNEAIRTRNRHKGNEAALFREGGNILDPEERTLLGELIGTSFVHLQCNCGEETLSLAQLGATVTGVDISDTAIHTARLLLEATGLPATFLRMDVYDWLEEAAQAVERFDGVFSSYGSVIWLSDLSRWAKGIAAILKPGGRFVLLEMHPMLLMFDADWTLKSPYSSEGNVLTFEEGVGDIVKHATGHLEEVETYSNPFPTYEFAWSMGEVVTALLEAELTLTVLKEYQYAYCDSGYKRMRQTASGRWLPPQELPDLPLRYGIVAQKGNLPRETSTTRQ